MTAQTELVHDIAQKREVWKAYASGLLGSIQLIVLASICAGLVNTYLPLGLMLIKILQLISIIPGAAALYGHRAWLLRPTTNPSPAAVSLDKKIFTQLTIASFFFAVLAFQLSPPEST